MSWFNKFFRFHPTPRKAGSTRSVGLTLEQLEDRQLLSGIPALSSLPGAPNMLYLDFTGRHAQAGGTGFDIDGDPAINDREAAIITEVWKRVSEAYSPFNLNVTTVDPGTYPPGGHGGVGVEVVAIGGSSGGTEGGASYWSGYGMWGRNTAYVYPDDLQNNPRFIADAVSHEAGHAFGLYHQSLWENGVLVNEYNPGNADVAPIMGNSYGAARSLWWSGPTKYSAGDIQDDLWKMATYLQFREDGVSHGLDSGTSLVYVPLAGVEAYVVNHHGLDSATSLGSDPKWQHNGVLVLINRPDYYTFTTIGGDLNARVDVSEVGATLDAQLKLLDSNGQVLAVANSPTSLGAVLSFPHLAGGKYYLEVASKGGNWGDVGSYTFSGGVTPPEVDLYPANLVQVAWSFTHGEEQYQGLVTRDYQQYLGRAPEAAGLAAWVGNLQSGMSDEQLEAHFIGSAEYIANHGGSGAEWIKGMYQDLLGRQADAPGLAGWLNELAQGKSPESIAYGFAASAERESQRITADYQTYLGRTPESQDIVNQWVNGFQHGKSNEEVIAGFVGSEEYYRNAQKGDQSRARWITHAYQDVLHRSAGADEVAGWLQVLRQP